VSHLRVLARLPLAHPDEEVWPTWIVASVVI
jgi:hypothetical protein